MHRPIHTYIIGILRDDRGLHIQVSDRKSNAESKLQCAKFRIVFPFVFESTVGFTWIELVSLDSKVHMTKLNSKVAAVEVQSLLE